MSYILFGSVRVPTYWLMLGIGSLAMMLYVWTRRKQVGLSGVQSVVFMALCIVGGFLAGKLVNGLTNWETALEYGFFSGGQSIFGPVFFDILLVPLVGMAFGLKRRDAHDLCGPSLAILIAFQRIGCYLTGCCRGWVVNILGLSFQWPAQAIESIGDFIIFSILLEWDKRGTHKGRLYPLFLVYYGTLRFFVEFLRVSEKKILHLSQWQWYAMAAVLIGLIWDRRAKEQNYAKKEKTDL